MNGTKDENPFEECSSSGLNSGASLIVENIGVKYPNYNISRRFWDIFKLSGNERYFWALRDVSFEAAEGEILYIIGRNGAGKTTLLKVLAGTLFPDEGSYKISGEMHAFLSMGLGFRRDLNGYHNIDLSLLLMGIAKRDIPKLTKDIEEFTELGNFLNAPVSCYSAGMRSRLAFAIATCVNPDIILMDEVMSAGDEQFREKCDERIDKILRQSKTVVICTHSLRQAEERATTVLWIEKGRIQEYGNPKSVVGNYRKFIRHVRNNPMYDLKTHRSAGQTAEETQSAEKRKRDK